MSKATVTRFGAYGVVLQDSKILLTLKKSGPYKGLWDLPGGGIEFGETPEDTLKRELLEEVTLAASKIELLSIATSIGVYDTQGEPFKFHHIGIIYKVHAFTLMPHLKPEEEGRWFMPNVSIQSLTPFARHAIEN